MGLTKDEYAKEEGFTDYDSLEKTTKEDIEAMERHIVDNCKRIDQLNADNAVKYKKLEEMQKNCKHDFELVGAYAGAVFECKKCGIVEGG